jgi:hypothetical protein
MRVMVRITADAGGCLLLSRFNDLSVAPDQSRGVLDLAIQDGEPVAHPTLASRQIDGERRAAHPS